MDDRVEIRFGGVRYDFWQSVDVRESVDDLCASVSLAMGRSGPGNDLGLSANTVVQVLIGGEIITTVRVDQLRRRVGPSDHDIELAARSLGRELVDCQYSVTLSGLKLGEIIQRLGRTFKVPVQLDAATAAIADFSMQCEAPANALINAVRTANLLLYPRPDGGLLLTAPSSAAPVTMMEYGRHFVRYNIVDEYKLRFSDYVVKGYDYAADEALKGGATDAGIAYFRPLHIVADRHGQSLGGCGRRAELERNRRQARAHRIELEVPGWRYQDAQGQLRPWAINTQVRVLIPSEAIDSVFLIGERAFRLDEKGGSITALTLMHRNAYATTAAKEGGQ